MGIRRIKVCVLAFASMVSTSVFAQGVSNKILEQLEKGAVISGTAGSAIIVQALVKKDSASISRALTEDLRKLPLSIPHITFARAFKHNKKNIVYLKLNGAGDGTGILMEMKEGPADAFANAREFLKSGDTSQYREPAKAELNDVGDMGLRAAIASENKNGSAQRSLGADSVLLLEGPLNEVPLFPGVRVSLQISVAPYTILSSDVTKSPQLSLLQVRAAFGNQAVIGRELGDYRGFGDRHLELAKTAADTVVRAMRARVEAR